VNAQLQLQLHKHGHCALSPKELPTAVNERPKRKMVLQSTPCSVDRYSLQACQLETLRCGCGK
jgi:hypothetical protein